LIPPIQIVEMADKRRCREGKTKGMGLSEVFDSE
jgi:hypothetical protein